VIYLEAKPMENPLKMVKPCSQWGVCFVESLNYGVIKTDYIITQKKEEQK